MAWCYGVIASWPPARGRPALHETVGSPREMALALPQLPQGEGEDFVSCYPHSAEAISSLKNVGTPVRQEIASSLHASQ
jgi:hypothetical protein